MRTVLFVNLFLFERSIECGLIYKCNPLTTKHLVFLGQTCSETPPKLILGGCIRGGEEVKPSSSQSPPPAAEADFTFFPE